MRQGNPGEVPWGRSTLAHRPSTCCCSYACTHAGDVSFLVTMHEPVRMRCELDVMHCVVRSKGESSGCDLGAASASAHLAAQQR